MTPPKQQTLKNHASFDPAYHGVASIALLGNLIIGIIFVVLSLHTQLLLSIWILVLSVTLLLVFIKLRTYPLKIQDRIIRLEERLRLDALLPESTRRRIPELTEDQLIGLRFASDEEIPELVLTTLDHNLTRKQIKEKIQNWRPDHFRI
jgi:hypothetical protein